MVFGKRYKILEKFFIISMDAFAPVFAALFTNSFFSLILSLIALILSIIALIYSRKAVKKTVPQVQAPKPPEKKEVEVKALEKPAKEAAPEKAPPRVELLQAPARPPPAEVKGIPEIKPKKEETALRFDSLEDLAAIIGMDSLLLFNMMGMSIESYNVSEENRVAASLADFVATIRKFDSSFNAVSIENDLKTMIFAVGRVGEMEVFALSVGKTELELEEVRELLKTYLSDLMGRTG